MPFRFNPADYKNTFPATVIESDLHQWDKNPNQEFWGLVIQRVKMNNKGEWEPMEANFVCQLPSCTHDKALWHQHYRYWESDRPQSPAHKFVLSITENGHHQIQSARDLLGKTFVWEEEIVPGKMNPTTNEKGKDNRYVYVAGPITAIHETDEPEIGVIEELPFDAGNGTASEAETEAALTMEQAEILISEWGDGKNDTGIRLLVREYGDILSTNKAAVVDIIQGTMAKRLVDKGMMTKDAEGVYHKVG